MSNPQWPYRNPELSIDERVEDLVSRLTVREKVAQMLHEAPAIERLGVPAYNWWNECLHGVARAGIATVFPQAIGLAAMWNVPLLRRIADIISDEARAKHHEFIRSGDHGIYKGLTFWTPNINIFRDPRWGRGHETYGECPYLTGRCGVAFCQGLQGENEDYLKLVATPKHLAVHSGPESLRHSFDALVTIKDMRETYLPAFHECLVEANAQSVMAAYNRTNGEPCCASKTLLVKILRDEWGFGGYVVSDCWALKDFHENHKVTASPEDSAAAAVRAGCDLNCGCTYEHIPAALERGLLDEADLDACVKRLFTARMRLGMFDPSEQVPFASIPYDVVACDSHRAVARQAARESIVLLKNAGVLPLSKEIGSIAVIGPNAADDRVLVANYSGVPTQTITPLEGIRAAVSKKTRVLYTDGCPLIGSLQRDDNLSEAVSVARQADAVVLCLGLSAQIEGEQGDAGNSDASGDKVDLNLTGRQQDLLEAVVALGRPTVLVIVAGSALDLTWAQEHVGAIVDTWYAGETAGSALADVLFGDYSPAGRLPVTFPRSISDVPEFTNYSMQGRTYRFLEKAPLYPFGYGLSYTRFEYSDLALSTYCASLEQPIQLTVSVTNRGEIDGDEVVQLYIRDEVATTRVPHHRLAGFERIRLKAGASELVRFSVTAHELSLITDDGQRVLEPGDFTLFVGGSQPDKRSAELLGTRPLETRLTVTGAPRILPY